MSNEIRNYAPGFSLVITAQEIDLESDSSRLNNLIHGPVRAGLMIIAAFAVVLAVWGFWVPLEGGASAPGVISPITSKKTIQHLEGGIISEIRVHDGDVVAEGQPLMVIENVQELSAHDALQEERWSLIAKQARLDAERANLTEVEWPKELRFGDSQARAVIDAQQQVFETRRAAHRAKKSILKQRIEQLHEQIKGFNAQVESATQQLALIEEEIGAKRTLLDKGLIPKPDYLHLKRAQADIIGRRGKYLAQIAHAQQGIGEANMQLLAADAERSDQIANEAEKVRADLATVIQKLRGSADVLKRTIVESPVKGTIINLKFKTIGGIVQRGEPIMDIVPADDSLIIEARVSPIDVKSVHKGLLAKIRLPAYSSRSTPPIPGTVESVSADRVMDQYTRESFYLTRVSVDKEELHNIAPDVHLIPGMQADILIVVDRHTMFQYMFKPFLEVFRKSFHEL